MNRKEPPKTFMLILNLKTGEHGECAGWPRHLYISIISPFQSWI